MRKYGLRIGLVFWLTVVWVLLWGTLSAANILGGLAVAILVTVLLPLPVIPVQGRLHPLSMLRLLGRVVLDLIKASTQIAWLTVRPGPPPRSAVVRAPMEVKSDLTLALTAAILTLIPGTMVVDIDQANRVLYVHILDVRPDGAIDEFYRDLRHLEKLLIAAFERVDEWQPAPEGTAP
ncbi:Na+/H+ antiporter subunit E [Mycobacterium sp. SMC-4]|uniref:Na+/H+ antiporter subunit E n=1 Tax=Mycobacterium sp. SMC-4 TaxID=2857059 RepID=UPI0021B2E0EB|nr:Na+/H+ antiporter subunit E [Mycobacterium sp. SMC-4]UXA20516.1 Na+/H+ antiporter subunit E [Mycobacterium sp. SMC-4]